MDRKEIIKISILTLLIAFMDITGIPAVFFVNIQIADIEPVYLTLMINHMIIGLTACLAMKYLCPDWKLGIKREGLANGLRKYALIGVAVAMTGFIAFYVGLRPFDLKPGLLKVLVEGVVYYIGVAIVEELYVRGLLLNLIERICGKSKNSTAIAVLLSSVIFGLGHVFGVLNQPVPVIAGKVIWTIGMGIFFGAVYKKTSNLWLPIILHFLINLGALPYCFSSQQGYANLTLYLIVPAYIILGIYSLGILKRSYVKETRIFDSYKR